MMRTAILALTAAGVETARRLRAGLAESDVHAPKEHCSDQEAPFEAPLREELPRLFSSSRALVCVMASGIVVRLLAPHLKGKEYDPAVVVVDEAGRFAISLLAGHLGGANALAEQTADILGGTPVITTATDVQGLPAWDEIARASGLTVEPVVHIKHLNSALLRGDRIALVDPKRRIAEHYAGIEGVTVCGTFFEAEDPGFAARVVVTHRLLDELEKPVTLLLRPCDLVVGVGCNRDTPVDEIEQAVSEVLKNNSLSRSSVRGLATIEEKRDEEGLSAFAERWRLPIDYHDAKQLNEVTVPSPVSEYAMAAVGARGVCEPAALLSAHPGRLLVKKQKFGNVTVAVAECHD